MVSTQSPISAASESPKRTKGSGAFASIRSTAASYSGSVLTCLTGNCLPSAVCTTSLGLSLDDVLVRQHDACRGDNEA